MVGVWYPTVITFDGHTGFMLGVRIFGLDCPNRITARIYIDTGNDLFVQPEHSPSIEYVADASGTFGIISTYETTETIESTFAHSGSNLESSFRLAYEFEYTSGTTETRHSDLVEIDDLSDTASGGRSITAGALTDDSFWFFYHRNQNFFPSLFDQDQNSG